MALTKIQDRSRLLATIVRDVLKSERFESLADLTEAVKTRCARLRIGWTNDDITDAYRLIESNTPLTPRPARRRLRRVEHPNVWPIGREEAADLVARLYAAVERQP